MSFISSKQTNATKIITTIALSLAIFFRSYLEWLLFDFSPDKKNQIASSLNLYDGHGISIAYAKALDLSSIIYEGIGLWPPGFALTLVPLLSLGFTPVRASLLLEILSIIILFISTFGIFNLLKGKISAWIPPAFFIFQAVTTSLYRASFTTDLVSFSFSVCSLYILLKILKGNTKVAPAISLGIISFLPSFFRFAYYPISILLPFLLLAFAILVDRKHLKAGLLSLTTTITLILLQLWHQTSLPTGISYLNEYHPQPFSAPYWKNLTMFINLPMDLMVDTYLFKRTIHQINPFLLEIITWVGWAILIMVGLILLYSIIRDIKTNRRTFFLLYQNQFLICSILLCSTIFLFLTGLSLRYPPEEAPWMPSGKWTYVAETRYFALAIYLLPLVFLIGLPVLYKKRVIKICLIGIILVFFVFSISVNLYHLKKYGTGTMEENYSRYYHHRLDLDNFLDTKASTKENNLRYSPSLEDDEYAQYAMLVQIPLVPLSELEKDLHTTKPVRIIINLSKKQRPEVQKRVRRIIEKYHLQTIKEFPDMSLKFYELSLP